MWGGGVGAKSYDRKKAFIQYSLHFAQYGMLLRYVNLLQAPIEEGIDNEASESEDVHMASYPGVFKP